jgi:hypothetical protein
MRAAHEKWLTAASRRTQLPAAARAAPPRAQRGETAVARFERLLGRP